jgi:adenosylcobinamide-phosphate synthase
VSVTPIEVLAGVGLDLLFGDPRWLPHPVRGLGWLITRLESFWRWTRLPLRLAGIGLVVLALAVALAVVWLTLPWANIFWIWALLAIRDLDVEATRVLRRLEAADLGGAREMLSRIVGRDTSNLDEPEILRAAVETLAENLSDAVIAPLFYLALAGPLGMAAYKTVNTLDSMVGYRDERYRELGWASARLDDVANFIPARLTALLVWICALLLGYDARRSLRVTLRDGASQPSPNAGYPEAAVAGALGVQLGGLNHYAGAVSYKHHLGDPVRALSRESFGQARRILYVTSVLMVLATCGVLV